VAAASLRHTSSSCVQGGVAAPAIAMMYMQAQGEDEGTGGGGGGLLAARALRLRDDVTALLLPQEDVQHGHDGGFVAVRHAQPAEELNLARRF
jgi:hypothetical protein